MKIFLICPIRDKDQEENEHFTKLLEDQGHEVYYPARDTNQFGLELEICNANYNAMVEADIVAIVYDRESKGSHFDLGMAFALGKTVRYFDVGNRQSMKCFENFLIDYGALIR